MGQGNDGQQRDPRLQNLPPLRPTGRRPVCPDRPPWCRWFLLLSTQRKVSRVTPGSRCTKLVSRYSGRSSSFNHVADGVVGPSPEPAPEGRGDRRDQQGEEANQRPGPQGIYQLLGIDVHARDVQGATREQVELADQVTDGPEDLPEAQSGEG